MRMMFSKHGLWKFVNGTAILQNERSCKGRLQQEGNEGFYIAL
jgi:hypothetical protein